MSVGEHCIVRAELGMQYLKFDLSRDYASWLTSISKSIQWLL